MDLERKTTINSSAELQDLRRAIKKRQPNLDETPTCHAAVMILLVLHNKLSLQGAHLLLTKRATHLSSHGGEISFPGGRFDEVDNSLIDTALRETWEEIGLAPKAIEILGYLSPKRTRSTRQVLPCVGLANAPVTLNINADEVQQAFEVPLDFFCQSNLWAHEVMYEGTLRRIPYFEYQDHNIWGFTASVISVLCRELLGQPIDVKVLSAERVKPYNLSA